MRKALAFLAVVSVASLALGAPSMDFPVTKDAGMDMNSPNANSGAAGQVRGAKATWWEDCSFYDWNTTEIEAYIAANGGMGMVAKVEFFIRPVALWARDETDPVNIGIGVYGLHSQNDWAEGDGTSIWNNYNWTEGTMAATRNYAQHDYTTAGGTLPPADTVACVPWVEPGGNPVELRDTRLRGIQNAVDFISPADRAGWAAAPYDIGVQLDPAMVNDLLTNPINRGIILFEYDDLGHPDENWQVYMRDQGNQPDPYIRVTLVPEPASMLLIAVGGVGALLRRRR
jgi:hypothetical protein